MSSEYGRNAIDPWGRLAGYCSLVVALGTLAWVFFGSGADRSAIPDGKLESIVRGRVNQLYEQESATRQQRDDEMRGQWRKAHQDQLAAYKTAADGMLAKHQTLINQLVSQVQPAKSFTSEVDKTNLANALQPHPELPLTPASDDPVDATKAAVTVDEGPSKTDELFGPSETDAGQSNDDKGPLADDEGFGFTPLLTYVRESLRPGSQQVTGLVTVRNRGRGDAIVTKVEFTPSYDDDAVFAVDSPVALLADDEREIRSIVFSPQDNQAVQKGKHGIYARNLAEGLTVPAGQDLHFRLAVSNPTHLGWGFRGSFKISYNGFEPLVIEDVQMVFVGSDAVTR